MAPSCAHDRYDSQKGFWEAMKQWLWWHWSGPPSWDLKTGLEICPLNKNMGKFAL